MTMGYWVQVWIQGLSNTLHFAEANFWITLNPQAGGLDRAVGPGQRRRRGAQTQQHVCLAAATALRQRACVLPSSLRRGTWPFSSLRSLFLTLLVKVRSQKAELLDVRSSVGRDRLVSPVKARLSASHAGLWAQHLKCHHGLSLLAIEDCLLVVEPERCLLAHTRAVLSQGRHSFIYKEPRQRLLKLVTLKLFIEQ